VKIAVLGTGTVGRTIAERLGELGHEVAMGTRDVKATLARAEAGDDSPGSGGESRPFARWLEARPGVTLATFADAASGADVVVNATSGTVTMAALEAAGAENLAGKVLLDIANPLDFSQGMPPTLFVKDTDSLGERIQRAYPGVRVVKALNTLTAELMAHPRRLADGRHTVFVSGDDVAAKKTVTDLLTAFGHGDVVDLGDITTARGTEMLLPVWLRLWGALGTPNFNFKIVR
jgi:8-hydroxy-5-deazaflavin:NADPH oxidoreductase